MKLIDIFKTAIESGIKADPRKDRVNELLEDNKKALEKEEVVVYENKDWNPYDDSNILFGDNDLEVNSILVGIDIETPELLLADRLKEKGEKIDLVMAHHPEGKSLTGLYSMVKIQEDILLGAGVPVSTSEKILTDSYIKYERRLKGINFNRTVDSAKLLKLPFMNIHTPADNMVHDFLEKLFKENKPYKLGEIIDLLMYEDEYKYAEKYNCKPVITNGSKNSRAGKIYIDVTGGIEASDQIYQSLNNAGVSTLVGMHMSEAHLKKAKEYNINVIMAGHMASDSLGMNLMIDVLEKKKRFDKIIEISGFTRVER